MVTPEEQWQSLFSSPLVKPALLNHRLEDRRKTASAGNGARSSFVREIKTNLLNPNRMKTMMERAIAVRKALESVLREDFPDSEIVTRVTFISGSVQGRVRDGNDLKFVSIAESVYEGQECEPDEIIDWVRSVGVDGSKLRAGSDYALLIDGSEHYGSIKDEGTALEY